MNAVRWRALIVAGVMIAGAILTHFGRPTTRLADQIGEPHLESLFPKKFGSWRLNENQPAFVAPPDVQAALDLIYNQVLTRSYVDNAGRSIMLSVAYGGDQYEGTSAHRPESCYPAQGFAITYSGTAAQQLPGGTLRVRNLVAKKGGRNEPITYWVIVGDEVATTGIEQKLAQVRYGLRGVIADGMLVRVSSIDADKARAYSAQADFIAELAAAMPGQDRSRVFGASAL
jgi:EpsI family protein